MRSGDIKEMQMSGGEGKEVGVFRRRLIEKEGHRLSPSSVVTTFLFPTLTTSSPPRLSVTGLFVCQNWVFFYFYFPHSSRPAPPLCPLLTLEHLSAYWGV